MSFIEDWDCYDYVMVDDTLPMTAADTRRRRLEGMWLHYGPAIPYNDDGHTMVQDVLQQALADIMGLPLCYLQATHVETVDVMDTLRTDLEDALAHAFFNSLDRITVPVEVAPRYPTLLRLEDCPMCDASGELYGVVCPTCFGYGLEEKPVAE